MDDAPIGHVFDGFCANDHFEEHSGEGAQAVDDEDAIIPPGIDRAEFLPRALIGEVVQNGVEVENRVILATLHILHLCEAAEVEFTDGVSGLLESPETLRAGLDVVPVEV